ALTAGPFDPGAGPCGLVEGAAGALRDPCSLTALSGVSISSPRIWRWVPQGSTAGDESVNGVAQFAPFNLPQRCLAPCFGHLAQRANEDAERALGKVAVGVIALIGGFGDGLEHPSG